MRIRFCLLKTSSYDFLSSSSFLRIFQESITRSSAFSESWLFLS